MNPTQLSTAMEIVAPALGQTLSTEQKTAIETSLTVLKQKQGFHFVFFWGRVNGLEADYLVAHGAKFPLAILDTDVSPEQRFFSLDGTKWDKLEPIDAATAARCASITKPFQGSPSMATTLLERAAPAAPPADGEEEEAPVEAEDDDEPAPEGFTKVLVTEVQRLAFAVKAISDAALVMPRGMMMLDSNDVVTLNPSYYGLSGEELSKPSNFLHWRPTANPKTKVKLGAAASDSLDFLESIVDDVPKGCWSFQTNSTSSAMTLRHLVWPGALSFAVIGDQMAGFAYFGSGLPNQDIAFML